jgi:hypothetical protein
MSNYYNDKTMKIIKSVFPESMSESPAIQNKYLKYKQKYFNLKKMIGGGIDANYKEDGNILTLTFIDKKTKEEEEEEEKEIKYTIIKELGEGTYGIVYLIQKNGTKEKDEYIFKKGKTWLNNSYNEGKNQIC